ncbi:ComF family protein [Trueperella bialowiezensis]|uniref:DNA utilization protein GntX n=1 Tax=Trueperella bialowiezensis TaxID=312285 RepID=A0A448PD89_9ACTO|nr:phosphoribosyltransferase family protein [Trueperella bialowiezensis]VEI12888.1 DNA utilization protein GntX [Trueperella bialowiezensis]
METTEWLTRLRDVWNDALDIVFPRSCAGCGQWDEDLCAQCAALFSTTWYRVDEQLPYLSHVDPEGGPDISPFPVFALADYAGAVAQAIVRWKNVADQRLDRAFSDVIGRTGVPQIPAQRGPATIVAAPSSGKRTRQGRFVAGVIAQALADHTGANYVNVLRRGRTGRVRGLEARGHKTRNVAVVHGAQLRGRDVVIVDDVVTTGATLAGASRAVKSAGGRVIASFALAATPNPR